MNQRERLWLAIFIAAVAVRIISLSAYPLHDTTEARYSEIARLMVASGDWITPHISADEPFWGKPPLSFWLTAASFKVFGLNEFAARLPSLLVMLMSVYLVYRLGGKMVSRATGIGAMAIMMTSVMGFVGSGAVMTDATLMFAVSLAMVSFWMAVGEYERQWRYGFFIGLGLGLLAKGPVVLVLVGLPVGVWLLRYRSIGQAIHCLPWIRGTLLMLAVAAPWYWLAEKNSPGFFQYFIVGEHFLRFAQSGWQGDLYGSAHSHVRGTIWLFAVAAALPWSVVAILAACTTERSGRTLQSLSEYHAFLLLWMLAPLFFFTFAGNILPAYVLPGLPAFALLLSESLNRSRSITLHVGWAVPLLVMLAGITSAVDLVSGRSQKDLVGYHYKASTRPLYYYPHTPFSADFYSEGRAHELGSRDKLLRILIEPGTASIAVKRNHLVDLPAGTDECLKVGASFARHLLLEKQGSCDLPVEQLAAE